MNANNMTDLSTNVTVTGALPESRNIETITAEIQFYKKQTGEGILEIGKRLNEAKEQLEYGKWSEWLSSRIDFSETVALRFMRLAREYDDPSLVTSLGSTKALILLALPPAEREDFMEETHDVNGEEKSVVDMTKRDLENAVRERAEALERQAVAEAAEKEAKRIAEESEKKLAEVDERATAAEAEAKRLAEELETLRNAPPGPLPEEEGQQTMEAIREEAAKAAKKETEEKLKQKINDATGDKKKAEAERDLIKEKAEREMTEAADKITALEKKLAAASSETVTIFKTHFENAQSCMNSMLGCIKKLGNSPETRDKLTAALKALCTKTLDGLPTAGSPEEVPIDENVESENES